MFRPWQSHPKAESNFLSIGRVVGESFRWSVTRFCRLLSTQLRTGYSGVRRTRGRRIGVSFGARAAEGVFQQRMPRPELASGHPRPAVLGPVRGCAGALFPRGISVS